jgi:hypothetical protein
VTGRRGTEEERQEVARQEAAIIATQLQQILHAIDNVLLPAVGLSSVDRFFVGRDPTRWMRKRLLAFEQMSIDDFVESISRLSPSDL